MSRYIDADEFMARCYQELKECEGEDFKEGIRWMMVDVVELQTVDVVPISQIDQIKWERDMAFEQIREIGGEPFMKWECTDVVHVVRCKDCRRKLICGKGDNYFCAEGEKISR